MAVPGSPLDPRAQGCNGLIRQGATLIQCAADVLEVIRPLSPRVADGRLEFEPPLLIDLDEEPDPSERERVENLLGSAAVAIDELVRQSGLPSGAVQLVLLELDLGGRLDRHAGGKVSLRPA